MAGLNGGMDSHVLLFEDVTDWYIPDKEEQQLLVYPGAIVATPDLAAHAKNMRDMVQWRQGQDSEVIRDWRMEYRGLSFRVHKQRTVDGLMYILRRISTELPQLSKLGLPAEILQIVTKSSYGELGGLVLVTGGPGHGKSTTCAAILIERVLQFGYFCLTVEDPPEFSLHGDHVAKNGRVGKIVQVPANTESFAIDLKDALRCYPANVRGSMLMVGEIRDGDTAAQVLRSAVNGQLVFSTLHASDPIAALERILTLAKESMGTEEAQSLLAHSLRAVLQQQLIAGKLYMDPLLSMGSHSSVASRIKTGNMAMLGTDIQQQKVQSQHGKLIESLRTK